VYIVNPDQSSPVIHHIQIAIPAGGEAAARAFYVVLVGLAEVPKPDSLAGRGGIWLDAGSIGLHLGVDPDFRAATKAHVAFTVDGLEALRERLALAGYPIVEDEELPGFERFYTADPFGNRIEFLRPVG
jgi:catechol 2,3-dioxygenase-like lactoylglutathione lyase family enzyme